MIRSVDAPPTPAEFGFLDRAARRVVVGRLTGLRRGELRLSDSFATSGGGESEESPVTIRVHRPRFYRRLIAGGSTAAADSYLDGDWECDDLTALFRLFIRNRDAASSFDRGVARLAGGVHRLGHAMRRNSTSGSKRNIAAHYDLGNDFYRLWLDETLAYSSGVFLDAEWSLHEASVEKFDRVCRKLDLRPGDRLLEIGTGWGGFALHAAGVYGCRVTTTTISDRQHRYAAERFAADPAGARIRLLKDDYRQLRGRFDKLASIEMIEAVGKNYWDDYFRRCSRLLHSHGTFVLQGIVIADRYFDEYVRSVDFIQRHVFPGGCLPGIGAIVDAVGRTTDLRPVHLEDFAPHYAETLRRWRQRFSAALDDVRALGCSERFIRLWRYYLCYCEAAFEERNVGVVQMQFDKPDCRRDPLTHCSRATAGRAAGATLDPNWSAIGESVR